MWLVGKTSPRRLQRLTSFSSVTARGGAACAGGAFSTDSPYGGGSSGMRRLAQTDDLGRYTTARRDLQDRHGAGYVSQIARQGGAPRIHHQRPTEAGNSLEMAV